MAGNDFFCPYCPTKLGSSKNLQRHIRSQHSNVAYDCCWCNYQSCRRLDRFKDHCRHSHSDKNYKCGKCGWQLTEYGFFEKHHLEQCLAYNRAGVVHNLEPLPAVSNDTIQFPEDPAELTEDNPLWQDALIKPLTADADAVEALENHWRFYRQHFRTGDPLAHTYTFRVAGSDVGNINPHDTLNYIYTSVGTAFTWNCGLTVLLKSVQEHTLKPYLVYIAEHNRTNILERNVFVHNLDSLRLAKDKLEMALEKAVENQDRPNTTYVFVALLSITFYVHLRHNFVSGGVGKRQLPSFISKRQHIVAMESDQNHHLYRDRLCAFRCLLAAAGGDYHNLEQVHRFYELYRARVNGPQANVFPGLPEAEIPTLEVVYSVCIQVFRQTEKDQPVVCLRKTTVDDGTPLINLHSFPVTPDLAHFSLITNLDGFAGRYCCSNCGAMFRTKRHYDRHGRDNCNSGDPVSEYPGGTFNTGSTVWDRLLEYGIEVPLNKRLNKYFSIWDCESALEAVNDMIYKRVAGDERNDQRLQQWGVRVEQADVVKSKLQVRQKHTVVGTAIVSSVPGFEEPLFFHGADPAAVVTDVFKAMAAITIRQYEIMSEAFSSELAQLKALKEKAQEIVDAADGDKKQETTSLNKIDRLLLDLDKHCKESTFMGYNCGRYDLQLIKKYLFGDMVKQVREAKITKEEGTHRWPSAISRNGHILSITGCDIRIIDIYAFLPPGTPLSKFISTFTGGQESKGVFPYELVCSYDVLIQTTEFPPKVAFRSLLKCNKDIPDEDYADAKRVWDSLPEQNLLAFMRHYCIRDCQPTLKAALNMQEMYYREFGGIDVFRECVSIPSFTLKYLFKELARRDPGVRFHLFNADQAHLHRELTDSIVGGLSMVCKRVAVAGETPIRDDPNIIVKNIVGYDVNALYLNSFRHPQPTGRPDWWIQQEDGQFRRAAPTVDACLKKRKSWSEVEAMKYLEWVFKSRVQTAEDGRQVRLGVKNYRADGWCKDKKSAFFYEGCRWHRHPETNDCLSPSVHMDGVDPNIRATDAARNKELEDLGITVWILPECHFRAIKYLASLVRGNKPIRDPRLMRFEQDAHMYNQYMATKPKRKFQSKASVSYQEMAAAVFEGTLFGFVKCSKIETPEFLKERFSDFPPIIHHTDVSVEQLDPIMQERCVQKGVLKKPRDTVVAGYSSEHIWLFSPLVQFYHRQGLIIEIAQVVQYDPAPCFRFFMDNVTQYRKNGDVRPELAAQAEVAKLIGNSAYGKTLLNPFKQQDIKFVDGVETQEMHRSPYHHRTIPLAEDLYEVHMRKEKIYHNLPTVIGLATYGYAKLAMLEFWYDVIIQYVDRRKINLTCTDTDSLYLALAENTLDECVLPEKRQEWETTVKQKYFVLDPEAQKREPGLFKVEATGMAFIGLCPKMYILYDASKDVTKAKAKGVQAQRNADILTLENYRKILLNVPEGNCTVFNVSIRTVNNVVCTTVAEKAGLTGIYVKRKCIGPIEWGNTVPLDL